MDGKLLERIYRMYAKEIYLYLYSLCQDAAQAEDLMQEVFTRALLSLSDAHPNFRAWLYRVAHNLCINCGKKERRRSSILKAIQGGSAACRSGQSCLWQTAEENLLESLLNQERNRTLYQCMNQLPRLQREVLFLLYFTELKTKEIAAALELRPENIRVIACRGRRELRKLLEKEGYHAL